ncbi:hypothetical protein IEC97_07900 [Neobacillus cucumis]|uniref:hypothetical protein n=1 Tax=Neobacillus cucumis TaxID=1740721 RepID=UPI0018DF3110|nr:hypothetical protein [Neobacillus cucumis]MBI0577282.1 hypothetical protein [Neobacillus cucumis]
MKFKRLIKTIFPVFLIFTLLILPSPMSQVNAKMKTPNHSKTVKAATYITSFKKVHGKWVGKFDYIQWYFGKAADREFLKDCKCSKDMDGAPDGYWIRNVNPRIRTFTISKNAQFVLQTRNSYQVKWNEKVTRSQFIRFLKQRNKDHQVPFHIEIRKGVVTKITEQYIP